MCSVVLTLTPIPSPKCGFSNRYVSPFDVHIKKKLTGGARFELLGVDLLTPGLLPGPMRRLRRLRRPCEVSCTAKFTDADLAYSPAIRRLAERVVNSALKTRRPRRAANRRRHWGVEEEDQELELETEPEKEPEHRVNVVRVRVHGKKLVVEGEVTNGGPFLRVPFRCDFSPSVSQGGHMLQCKDPRVYWGAPGGHIPLPMLPLQSPLNIDLGDRCVFVFCHACGNVVHYIFNTLVNQYTVDVER